MAYPKTQTRPEHRYIGSFRVFIPWSRLTSESVTVEIENVVLVASPGDPAKWDPEELRKKNLDAKRVLLEKATEAARAWSSHSRRKTQEQKAESAGYFARLATRIADNIFVFLKNVHIRCAFPSGHTHAYPIHTHTHSHGTVHLNPTQFTPKTTPVSRTRYRTRRAHCPRA